MKKIIITILILFLFVTLQAQTKVIRGNQTITGSENVEGNLTVEDTLKLNGGILKNDSINITANARLNDELINFTIPNPIISNTTYTNHESDINILDNDIPAGSLRFEGTDAKITNNQDSIRYIFQHTYSTKTQTGFINVQRGFNQNTHIWANEDPGMTTANINIGGQFKNQLEPMNNGDSVSIGYNKTLQSTTIIGDDGGIKLDSSVSYLADVLLDSRDAGAVTSIGNLYGFQYSLKQGTNTGLTTIDKNIGLELRSDLDITPTLNYGIYEDFGDNYFTNNIETAESVTIGDVLKITPQASAPSDPALGWVYVDTDNHIYFYNGSGWVQMDN